MSVQVLNESSLARSQQFVDLKLVIKVTANTGCALFSWGGNRPAPRMIAEGGTGSALTLITQASVDALLGSTNEIVVANMFGTTAMVNDNTFGLVLDCGKQIDYVDVIECNIDTTAGAVAGRMTPAFGTKTALTNAGFSATPLQCYVSDAGNIAMRIYYVSTTGISDATSAGYVHITLRAKLK